MQRNHECFTIEAIEQAAASEGVDIGEFNLTEPICLPRASDTDALRTSLHNGIPDGIVCDASSWCDSQGMCTRVCKKGTVQIDSWYQWAAEWQRNASRSRPLCHASLLGSHNSAITLADGYGNQDMYWQSFLEYLPSLGTQPLLRTNNQWLSVTDQLNIGVRVVEVDTHWFEGGLRAAHCGGLHAKALNQFIGLLNSLSKLTGNRIRWDTETIGCSPSLSSIPVRDQRHVADVLREIADWLQLPANADEVIIIFFDDEKDIAKWGKVANLIRTVREAFPAEWLYTPANKQHPGAHLWPSIAELRQLGRRLVLVNRQDYGPAAGELMFRKEQFCGWFEPAIWELGAPPRCGSIFSNHSHPQDGSFCRINDCQLVYGPLNCNFMPRSADDRHQQFSPSNIQSTSMCGWNCISPDWLTPALAHGTIWSWAPGEPRSLGLSSRIPAATDASAGPSTSVREGIHPVESVGGVFAHSEGVSRSDAAGDEAAAAAWGCVAMSVLDGRWRSVSCDNALPIACKALPKEDVRGAGTRAWASASGSLQGGPVGRPEWDLGCNSIFSVAEGWRCKGIARESVDMAQGVLGGSVRTLAGRRESGLTGVRGGKCVPGFTVAYPHTAWENVALWNALSESGEARVMLPLRPHDNPVVLV